MLQSASHWRLSKGFRQVIKDLHRINYKNSPHGVVAAEVGKPQETGMRRNKKERIGCLNGLFMFFLFISGVLLTYSASLGLLSYVPGIGEKGQVTAVWCKKVRKTYSCEGVFERADGKVVERVEIFGDIEPGATKKATQFLWDKSDPEGDVYIAEGWLPAFTYLVVTGMGLILVVPIAFITVNRLFRH